MIEPADRPGLHWQPPDVAERESLFDQVDAFLASRPRVRPDEDIDPGYDCPDCGNPCLRQHFRYGPGGIACCPTCGWEEPPL